MELAGRPMLEWSLEALAASRLVSGVVVAVPAGYEGRVEAHAVAGGETRADSVANALAHCTTDLVVIHDAARPLAEPALFDSVIETLDQDESLAGVIAASPIADTVKSVSGDEITGTVDRESLRAAETPQAFRRAALEAALAVGDRSSATDEAMLVEAAGGRVATLESAQENFKVTTAADLERAAAILSSRS